MQATDTVSSPHNESSEAKLDITSAVLPEPIGLDNGCIETDSRRDDRDFKVYSQHSRAERQIISHLEDSELTLEYYSINTLHLGRVIIFDHATYSKRFNGNTKPPSTRSGTEEDVRRLREVFEGLNCAPIDVYYDKTEKEIEDLLKRAAEFDYSDHSCLIIVVLSHGDENELYAYDNKYDVRNLWKPFIKSNRPNKTLAGKPKVFLIQACRGDSLDAGQYVSLCVPDGVMRSTVKRIPMCADLFVAYSSFLGYKSIRHTELGSWFIQTLCDCIERFKDEYDLLSLLTIVQHHVAHAKTYMHDKKQIPCFESTLTKRFYLTPQVDTAKLPMSVMAKASVHGIRERTDAAEKDETLSVAPKRQWVAVAIAATALTTFVVTKYAS